MKRKMKIQWLGSLLVMLFLNVPGSYAQNIFNMAADLLEDDSSVTDESPEQSSSELSEAENAVPVQPSPIPGLEAKAVAGDAYSQAVLGWHYWTGFGVKEDATKASELFWKSARQNHPLGLFGVANLVNAGEGGNAKNEEKAKLIYQKARPALESLATAGDPYAQAELGRMYDLGLGLETNYAEAAKWYQKAATQGSVRGQIGLGYSYQYGEGVEKNAEEAVKWYRKAAEQGFADAQCNLGFMYDTGQGVEKNAEEAVKWYLKAAEQGQARGQFNTGKYYYDKAENTDTFDDLMDMNDMDETENSSYIANPYEEAEKWFLKSAEQGNSDAQNFLGIMYQNGQGVEKDYVEASKWYQKAAEQGNGSAQYNLGGLYANGKGVEQSDAEALKWYQKAADQGNEKAKQKVAELAYRISPPMEFNYEKIKAQANASKGNTLVFKDFYLGMPIEDALGLINHRMGLAQVSATPVEDKGMMSQAKSGSDLTSSFNATMVQALGSQFQGMSKAQLRAQGLDEATIDAIGVSDPTDSYRIYSKQGMKVIARNTQERPFAIADASGKVVSMEMNQRLLGQLFSAQNTPAQEFLESFITAYDIDGMDSQVQKIMATVMGTSKEIGFQNVLNHRSPKGFEVTYYGESVITEDGFETFANTPPEGSLEIKKIGTAKERQSSFD